MGRFRLFFRFDSASKVIIYAWVNDENTLRKVGRGPFRMSCFSAGWRKAPTGRLGDIVSRGD